MSGEPWERLTQYEKDHLAKCRAEKRARRARDYRIRLSMPRPPRARRACVQFSLRAHKRLMQVQKMANALRVVTKPNARRITLCAILAEAVEWYYQRARRRLKKFAREQPSMRESVQMILDDG